MKEKKEYVYVVIDTELGWDNICAIFKDKKTAKKYKEDRGGDTTHCEKYEIEKSHIIC